MKRDLLFVAEQLLPLLDEKRLEMVARNRSIKSKDASQLPSCYQCLSVRLTKAQSASWLSKVWFCSPPDRSQTEARFSAQRPRHTASIRTQWLSRSSRSLPRRRRRGKPASQSRSQRQRRNERLSKLKSLDLPSGRSYFWFWPVFPP